ncbi:MAG: 5-(carboxyamino)imidazole ribonucleotide synthase [Verrucomicrobiota bacterium]
MHETYDSESKRLIEPSNHPVRLGIIGGGQLARMTAIAALPLGCEVVLLENNPFSPAARVSPDCIVGDWSDRDPLLKFAERCDVITLENEFVDAAALDFLEQAGHEVFPSAACIAVTQDKFTQKTVLQKAGLGVPQFRAVQSTDEAIATAREFGWPVVLKTRRNGYDGKGNFTLKSEADVAAGWQSLGGGKVELMVEAFVPFVKELAVIVTRGRDGATAVYPVVETVQRNHVCHLVKAPAQIPDELSKRAAALAKRAVEAVAGVGSFGVEMFLSADGELVINELAPRVHNSGHYTIEACGCSQFENHVRAVLGWPLGNPLMVAPAAVMVNLLGTEKTSGQARGLDSVLRMKGARVHLYGKMMSGPGRKMGHITVLEQSVEEAQAIAECAAKNIYFGEQS